MPFIKGQGGRPLGARNKASMFRDTLDALAVDVDGQDLHLARLNKLAQDEDPQVALRALQLLLSYRYGKPTEYVEVTGEDGGPVTVRFVEIAPQNADRPRAGA